MRLWIHKPREVDRRRYVFVADDLALALGIAGIGAGSGIMGGLFGDEDNEESSSIQTEEPKWYQAPDYPEATEARQGAGRTLMDWGKSGSYGAVLPNYDAIFENAKKRINEYYWGGASSPGVIDKIRAGAARRGVAESPAIDVLSQRMGVDEAGKLGDISTEVDTQKAGAIEQARGNYLNSLMALSQLKPSGTWGGTTTRTNYGAQTGIGDVISTAGAGIQEGLTNYTNASWMSGMLDKYLKSMKEQDEGYRMPKQTQYSLTGAMGMPDSDAYQMGGF